MVQGEAKMRNSCPGCGMMMLSHYISLVNREVPLKPEFDLTRAVVHSVLVVSAPLANTSLPEGLHRLTLSARSGRISVPGQIHLLSPLLADLFNTAAHAGL